MKNSFDCYIDSATAQKKLFQQSVDNVKSSLVKVVAEASSYNYKKQLSSKNDEPIYSTGWLRGALSYPWALCLLVPSFLETIF